MKHLLRCAHVMVMCLLTTLMSLGITACRQQDVDLPFENIEQLDSSGTGKVYEDEQPSLVIVAKPDEATNLNALITSKAQTQLQNQDYNTYFSIAVFQGWKQSTRYGVQIERVARLGDTVIVYAVFQEPQPDELKGAAITSPYHLIKVQKVGDWGKKIAFKLIVANATVASLSHDVP